MMTSVKEIHKEFNEAKRHFKRAIELAKKNLIVGELIFSTDEKKIKIRVKKVKVAPEPEGKADLADLDKDGYMSKRQKRETADNAIT